MCMDNEEKVLYNHLLFIVHPLLLDERQTRAEPDQSALDCRIHSAVKFRKERIYDQQKITARP